MEKPIILAELDMKKDFVEVLNKHIHIVPASMIVNALNEMLAQTSQIAEQQIRDAQAQYEKSLKESDNDG